MEVKGTEDAEKMGISREMANQLNKFGATVLLLGVPKGTEVGVDLAAWRADDKFMGFKMIVPGIHWVSYACVRAPRRVAGPR